MPEADATENLWDFRGKLIWLFFSMTKRNRPKGVLVEYPEFEVENGVYLKGRIPKAVEGQWVVNEPITVPWSSVTHFVLFRSREEYFARCRERGKSNRQSA